MPTPSSSVVLSKTTPEISPLETKQPAIKFFVQLLFSGLFQLPRFSLHQKKTAQPPKKMKSL